MFVFCPITGLAVHSGFISSTSYSNFSLPFSLSPPLKLSYQLSYFLLIYFSPFHLPFQTFLPSFKSLFSFYWFFSTFTSLMNFFHPLVTFSIFFSISAVHCLPLLFSPPGQLTFTLQSSSPSLHLVSCVTVRSRTHCTRLPMEGSHQAFRQSKDLSSDSLMAPCFFMSLKAPLLPL